MGLSDRPGALPRGGATALEEFVERYVVKLRSADRAAAVAALKDVVLEAQAVERRRLCTDARYLAAAVEQTREEIARHRRARAPQLRQRPPRPPRGDRAALGTGRAASHLASRLRSARSSMR
jgi:hypothetical protein